MICCFTPKSTVIAIPGYYVHFQHWDAMTSETYSNYNHLIKQLMLINIYAIKGFQSFFICINHFFQAGSDQLSKGWSVSFICKHKQAIFLTQPKMSGNISFCAACVILQNGGQEGMWARPSDQEKYISCFCLQAKILKNLLNDHLINELQHRKP